MNKTIRKERENVNKGKKPLIFISHSSKNKEQVKLLAELLRTINMIPRKDIFCSSLPGYDIPIDTEDQILDFLRDRFLEYEVHVFFIHSAEYYESAVSLNEMGAVWVLKSKATSFLLPGFEFSDMKGVINGDKIAIKVDNDVMEVKDKLNQLRKTLVEEFGLDQVPDITWEAARDKFIDEINKLEFQSAGTSAKSDSVLQEGISESDQAAIDRLDAESVNLDNRLGRGILYASNSVSYDEIDLLRANDEKIINANESGIDANNHKVIYKLCKTAVFERKFDGFLNQNVVVSVQIGELLIESITTFDNWRSKSYANNILSAGECECTMWFKILSEKGNLCRAQILLLEEC